MAQIILTLTIAAALMVVSHGVRPKRGCLAYGHSCFGGNGKKFHHSAKVASPGVMAGHHIGQEKTPPHPVYSHPYNNVLQPSDDIIPVRDGGAYDREDSGAREVMKLKPRNIFKHWVASPEVMARRQIEQVETSPHPVYPHPSNNVLQPGDNIIPVRDGGADGREDSGARKIDNYWR